jgi:hypothetical protein
MLKELELNPNALMDLNTFYHMYKTMVNSSFDEEDPEKKIMVTWAINGVSAAFERFCNRPLKAQDYSYKVGDANYNLAYTTFDPPPKNVFWFPTYPVNSLTTFLVFGNAVTPSTNSLATDGYILYNRTGKLVYDQGFYIGYYKTIQTEWNGGYKEGSYEMAELQVLCFRMVNSLLQSKSNPLLQSETIGGYKYQLFSPTLINAMRGLSPDVYSGLGRFRREAIG